MDGTVKTGGSICIYLKHEVFASCLVPFVTPTAISTDYLKLPCKPANVSFSLLGVYQL